MVAAIINILALAAGLWWLNRKLNRIIMKQAELATALADANNTIQANTIQLTTIIELAVKSGTETDELKAMIERLQDAINNQDNVSPEVQTALENVKTSAATQSQTIGQLLAVAKTNDDKVPDADPPPTP